MKIATVSAFSIWSKMGKCDTDFFRRLEWRCVPSGLMKSTGTAMEVMGAFICFQADWLAAELKAAIFNAPGNRPDERADIMWIIFIVSNILKPKHNVFEYALFIHYANELGRASRREQEY